MARKLSIVVVVLALVPAAWWAVAKSGGGPAGALDSASPSPSPLRPSIAASGRSSATSSVSPSAPAAPAFAFADGACVSFSARIPRERGVVFLDAGHGGIEPGAAAKASDGRTVQEKDATLAIVHEATRAFLDEGYRVVVSRWTDTTIIVPGVGDIRGGLLTPIGVRRDLLARIACANAARADVLLSVHLNSFSDPDVGGASMIYNANRTFSNENRRLAASLQRHVLASLRAAGLNVEDRRIMTDTANPGGALTEQGRRYGQSIVIGPYAKGWVDEPSAMPGVILEPLFLTRPEEADAATSAEGRAALAKAMTAAVREFLG